jgi:hypothetical protein
MKIYDVIRAAIPDASDQLCDFILWDRTYFPLGAVTPKDLYRAAARWRRAAERGIVLCELCDRIAVTGRWTCKRCEDALARARAR